MIHQKVPAFLGCYYSCNWPGNDDDDVGDPLQPLDIQNQTVELTQAS